MTDPKLESIVQKMIDAGESEDNIAGVIKEYQKQDPSTIVEQPQIHSQPDSYSGPDSWGEGVLQSLKSGDAAGAGLEGAGGWIRGAIADLPSSMLGMANDVAGLMSFGNPQRQVETGQRIIEGLKGLPGHISETFSQAGSHPHEFGRMMGQLTGQPIVTEGLIKGVPAVASAATKIPYRNVAIKAAPYVEHTGNAVQVAAPFMNGVGLAFPTFGAGQALRRIGRAMGKIEPTPLSDVEVLRQWHGGTKPPPAPPGSATINTEMGPLDRAPLVEAGESEADMAANIEKFYGGPKPPLFPPTGDISINTELGPFDRTPLQETPLSDAEAISQFRGPQGPPVQPTQPTINQGSDPFSRTPLPQSMFRAGTEDLHTQNQLENIADASSQPPLEGDPFSPENVAAMESENPPIIDDAGGTGWEELPSSGVPETPIDPAKLQEFADQLHTDVGETQPPKSEPKPKAKVEGPVEDPEVVRQNAITSTQGKIKRLLKYIQDTKEEFWKLEEEGQSKLPEGEQYIVPDSVANAHDAKISSMWKEHERLETKLRSLEKKPPPKE